jgi:hypothetical protein
MERTKQRTSPKTGSLLRKRNALRRGDPAGIRTPDTLLKRQVLCRLSYWVLYLCPYTPERNKFRSGKERASKVNDLAARRGREPAEAERRGWDGRTRTCECGSQSPVPYRLATSHREMSWKCD